MNIPHHFENAVDDALLYYMNHMTQLGRLYPPQNPFIESGRFFFLAAVPFFVYQAWAYPKIKIVFTITTIAYVAFKARSILLDYSASEGKIKLMKAMLFLGADVNRADFLGWTPLHHAAVSSHHEAIKTLLQHGADPIKDQAHGKSGFNYPNTPINWIVDAGNIKGFEIIEEDMLKKKLPLDYSTLLDVAQNSDKKNPDLISKIKKKLKHA